MIKAWNLPAAFMAAPELDPDHFLMFLQEATGNEKIVIKWNAGVHYTIHFGTKSGVIDIHRTREVPGRKPKRQTLLQVPHTAITEFGEALKPYLPEIIAGFTPMKPKLGRLRHRHMVAQVMEPSEMEKLGAIRFRNKGRKMQLAKGHELIDPNTIYRHIDQGLPAGSYLLKQARKGALRTKGFLYVVEGPAGKLFGVVPKQNMNALSTLLAPALGQLLEAAGAPMGRKARALFKQQEAKKIAMVIGAKSGERLVSSFTRADPIALEH